MGLDLSGLDAPELIKQLEASKDITSGLSPAKIATTQQRKWIDSSAVCILHYFFPTCCCRE